MTYPERSPIDGIDAVIVSTDDGTVFHVSPVFLGGPNSPYPVHVRLRWAVHRMSQRPHGDEMPDSYVGPPIQPDRSPAAVRALINEWWITRRSLKLAADSLFTTDR